MPPMRDWITSFFNTVIAKMHERGESMEVVSPSVNETDVETLHKDSNTQSQEPNEETKEVEA